jgi:hypothetical protein
MRQWFVWAGLFCLPFSASAAELQEIKEIGIEQKLERLYQLYRSGEVTTLKPREMRLGVSASYAVNEDNALGIRASAREFALQGSFALGVADWLEAGINVPLKWNEFRIETTDKTIAGESIAGIGDISTRFIAKLPVRIFEAVSILSLTLPTGTKSLDEPGVRSSLGFNVATMIRPAFVYGGFAWQRNWEDGRHGIGYKAGFGFYLNHSLSAGAELSGTRFLNPPKGGIYDVLAMTLQLSWQATRSIGVTPHMSMGLTGSAPDALMGITLLWRP